MLKNIEHIPLETIKILSLFYSQPAFHVSLQILRLFMCYFWVFFISMLLLRYICASMTSNNDAMLFMNSNVMHAWNVTYLNEHKRPSRSHNNHQGPSSVMHIRIKCDAFQANQETIFRSPHHNHQEPTKIIDNFF